MVVLELERILVHFLVHRLKWRKLKPIQKKAIKHITYGNDTLIVAPTASGKTEAAIIPIFNDIIRNKLEPASTIYISPLKALINDMYQRLCIWAHHLNLKVMKWHGDVSPNKKRAFIKQPTDFLLVTPESLEVILMNRTFQEKQRIFQNVKYFIIDEIHYFIESDRGTQLNSLLNRIEDYTKSRPIRIGLSATVGNPKTALEWLNPSEKRKIVFDKSSRNLKYKVFSGKRNELEEKMIEILKDYMDKKILIFVSSRSGTEKCYHILKRNLKPKNIYIHHASLDKEIREENEKKFKSSKKGFMVSTSTLELGIDIGNIDIVVHVNPPANTNQFLQRTGRSGRRTGTQKTIIFCEDEYQLLKSLAELSLTFNSKIEDLKIPRKPKDILFHQILSSLFETGKTKPKSLYERLTRSYIFSKITLDEFKEIIGHMEEKEFIKFINGYIYHGYNFERIYGKRNFTEFYTVFSPNYEFSVFHNLKKIGSLDTLFVLKFLKEGSTFMLGGKSWQVEKIDHNHFKVKVNPYHGKDIEIPRWYTMGGPLISYEVARELYKILTENFNKELLNYFDEESKKTLNTLIHIAKLVGFKKGAYIPIYTNGNIVEICTFGGMHINALISDIFKIEHKIYNIRNSEYCTVFMIQDELSYDDIVSLIHEIPKILDDDGVYNIMKNIGPFFVKNKFVDHLPPKDAMSIKFEILYKPEDFIRLINENKHLKIDEIFFLDDLSDYFANIRF